MSVNLVQQTPNANGLRAILTWYVFVLYFSVLYQTILAFSGLTSASSIKYAIVYNLPWLLVPLFIPKITKVWFALLGIAFAITSTIKLSYFLVYHQELSQSVFFTIFESNSAEAGEYLSNYFHWWYIPAIICYLLPPVWIYRQIVPVNRNYGTFGSLLLISALCVAEPFVKYAEAGNENSWHLANRKLQDRMSATTPWQLLISYWRYTDQIDQVQAFTARLEQSSDLDELKLGDVNAKQTYVLVIGESTNRQRMSLYGYPRATTPHLSAMGNDLFAFNDVITSIPYTVEALSQILTFSDQQHPEKTFEPANILSMMKQAGFTTYWISNQQTISSRNTILTAFSQLADKQVYLNNNRLQSSSQLDSIVFDAYRSALNDAAEKKLIIVHLMGTHLRYDHRYSSDYAKFSGEPVTHLALDTEQQRIYNDYDNAVLYNDYIVSSLLESFQTNADYGAFVYFSDHGEEVFDKREFYGRDSYNPSSDIYTVPLLVWGSDAWRSNRGLADSDSYIHRPYSMEDFIHSWCQISAIQYRQCDPHKSILSASYHKPTRLVISGRSPHKLISYKQLLAELYGEQVALRDDLGDTIE